jgi:CDP-diacylglycerol--glycerol-3-phosphate 3-phosphatidyltransferase
MSAIGVFEPGAAFALRRRAWEYSLSCLALLLAGFWFLRTTWEPSSALRWLGLATAGMGYVVWRVWSALGENYRPGENLLLPDLGPGNVISMVRGALIAGLGGFLFSSWPPDWLAWLPGILYTIAALMDGVDGIAARLSNHVTRLGETLDISFDSLGMLIVTALLAQYGQAPAWFFILGLARYIFLGGVWLRQRFGLPVYNLPYSSSRRMIAGLTFGFTFVLLWPILQPPGTIWAASFWALPFLGGFLLDWLVVSGVLKADYTTSISGFINFVTAWIPIFLRAGSVLLSSKDILEHLMNGFSVAYLNPWQYFFSKQIFWMEGIVLLALILGFAGRSFALAGLFLLGFHQHFAPLDLSQHILMYIYISLAFLGSGRLSVWQPEGMLIKRRIGEREV